MPRKFTTLVVLVFSLLLAAPHFAKAQSNDRWRQTRRVPRPSAYLKNNDQIKAVLRPVVASAAAATVRVYCDDKAVALGTIVAADGLILTKASLLGEKPECHLADGRTLAATVVGTDEASDLALLHVEAANLRPVVWGDTPAVGSMVAATSPGVGPTVIGAVSDAPQPMPGPNRHSEQHGWLGISVAPVDEGAEVEEITPGSAAEKAGLKNGDRIKRIDGATVESSDQFVEKLSRMPPNKKVSLMVSRDDKDVEIDVTLGRTPGKLPHDNWGGGPFSERRWGFAAVIPNDLTIAPADCGGPLVDIDGRCVGINIARALRVATYALPPSVAKQTIEKLQATAAQGKPVSAGK